MAEGKKIKWEELGKSVFLVNVLGIIYDPEKKKMLIGRRENDPYVPELTWCFPGDQPKIGEDLSETLKRSIKDQTGIEVEDLGTVFSRVFRENKKILLIYNLCEITGGKGDEKPGQELKELKWIDPEKLEDYFQTSFDPKLKEYIENLE